MAQGCFPTPGEWIAASPRVRKKIPTGMATRALWAGRVENLCAVETAGLEILKSRRRDDLGCGSNGERLQGPEGIWKTSQGLPKGFAAGRDGLWGAITQDLWERDEKG